MNAETLNKLYDGITNISAEYIEEAKTAKIKRSVPWAKWVALAAACACLLLAVLFVWKGAGKGPPIENPGINTSDGGVTIPLENPGINTSDGGVTIPPLDVSLSSDSLADMVLFFIYQGRSYMGYGGTDDRDDIVGEYLGTVTGMIDEWTPEDGYVDFAGSVTGDIYTVKGYDPAFILCMTFRDAVAFYVNNNGITMKNGSELLEDRCHLSEQYLTVQYMPDSAKHLGSYRRYQLNDPENAVIRELILQLDAAEFLPAEATIGDKNVFPWDKKIGSIYFILENGLEIPIGLYEGGYVFFYNFYGACLKIPDEQFADLIDLITDQTMWSALGRSKSDIQLEEGIADPE